MKKLLMALCLMTLTLGMSAQEEAKSSWVTGSQESSFPGEMIEYAICQNKGAIEGKLNPITVSIRIMTFKGVTKYMLVATGDEFVVDQIQTQKVLIQFDDEKASNFSLAGDNSYSAKTLIFEGTYKNKFKKSLKAGKVCKMDVEFKDSGNKTIEFNVEGLDPSYIK